MREQTRQRILEALIRALARGDTALSMRAVAREARVSVPTVYTYFANREELVAAFSE
jgi:AcrR family transcriptional regulator